MRPLPQPHRGFFIPGTVMDKMIEAVTVKLNADQLHQLRGVSEADGVGMSEYIRNLIDVDLRKRQAQYVALASIFGANAPTDKE
jgi:hypothetical protein